MTNKQVIELLDIIYTILDELDDISTYLYSNLASRIRTLKEEIKEND